MEKDDFEIMKDLENINQLKDVVDIEYHPLIDGKIDYILKHLQINDIKKILKERAKQR